MGTHPILLAHGICRFDLLLAHTVLPHDNGRSDCTHYWRLIRSTLAHDGFSVHHGNVPWAESVRVRAAALRQDVERVLFETGADKVHIIAHSMGGLDARHMLYEHRIDAIHEKVASLTTIGTPHLGTSFADVGLELAQSLLFVLALLRIDKLDGFRDLTTTSCRAFNERAADFEYGCGVRFRTVAGAQDKARVFTPLRDAWDVIQANEGDNDGLVSVTSATWRPEYRQHPVLDADHLNQLGWWHVTDLGLDLVPPFSPPHGEQRAHLERRIQRFYVDLARELAAAFPVV